MTNFKAIPVSQEHGTTEQPMRELAKTQGHKYTLNPKAMAIESNYHTEVSSGHGHKIKTCLKLQTEMIDFCWVLLVLRTYQKKSEKALPLKGLNQDENM